jgi:hypothetical protein
MTALGPPGANIMKITVVLPMENDIETVGSTKKKIPTIYDFRIHWQTEYETIGTDPQFENVGNPQKQVRIHWRIISNFIGRPNGKPLAQTLSQKSLAIHKYNSESIGTRSQNPLANQM